MFRVLLALGVLFVGSAVHEAQDPPFRTSLRDRFLVNGSSFGDVWGEGTFGYVGRLGTNIVEFYDVSDPDNALNPLAYNVPAPNNLMTAQELKVWNGLLFIAIGGSVAADSVQIVDVRNPLTPTLLTNVRVTSFLAPHNIFIEAGWLYICNGAGDGIAIVDLRNYDPDAAPAQINGATYTVTGAGSVHDITVTGDRLWVSDISGTHKVYDITDLGNNAPTLLGSIRGGSVHSSWPTSDHAFTVTADESVGGPLKLFEVIDNGTSVELIQRDARMNPLLGLQASANGHNPLIVGDRVYVANNVGGVICLQIDRTSLDWELVASYDTTNLPATAASGQGCWGVYPFLGHDRILASDRQAGFFVIDFSAIEITFDAARPETLPAGGVVALNVTTEELGGVTLDAASVALHTSVNGAPFVTTSMANTGGNGWSATFPVLTCGDRLDYYATADSLSGTEFSRPGEAPTEVYTAFGVAGLITVFEDDFETDKGWSAIATDEVNAGFFERGVPVDNRYQPPFDDPDGTGTMCYVTEIGTGGSDDLDGGLVALVSPVMDFTGQDGLISYSRWLYNDDSNGAQSSPLIVELSNDAGANWTMAESFLLGGGGWKQHAFRISDVLPPTALMQVRFRASDEPNNTTLEVGIDSFKAQAFGFIAAQATRNAGVNPVSYTASTMVLGQILSATVDNASAGQSTSILFGFDTPFTLTLSGGQTVLALDLGGSGELFTGAGLSPTGSAGGLDTYSFAVPNDCALGGFAVYSQAIQFGSPPFVLSNSQDQTIGGL